MAQSTNPESYMAQQKAKAFGARTITFPMEDRPHFMQLTFTKYLNNDPEVNKLKVPQNQIVKHLILPLPNQLQDGYNIKHAGTEFGALGAFALDSGQAVQKILDEIDTKTGASFDDVMSSFDGVTGTGIGKALLRKFANLDAGLAGAIDRTTGTTLNPHLISVFEGVDLRSFNWVWNVYPQTMTESQEMQKVLGEIRKLIHPPQTGASVGGKKDIFLLDYPHEVFGTIWVEDKPLIRMGRSVITNLSIDYAPSGPAAFFKGTHDPVNIQFGISMQEVTYMTEQDIDEMDDYPGRADAAANLTDSQGSF